MPCTEIKEVDKVSAEHIVAPRSHVFAPPSLGTYRFFNTCCFFFTGYLLTFLIGLLFDWPGLS